jgi:hypothetical protein
MRACDIAQLDQRNIGLVFLQKFFSYGAVLLGECVGILAPANTQESNSERFFHPA